MSAEGQTSFAAFVGIDWADAHHDIAFQACDAGSVEISRLAHTPASLTQWVASLRMRFGGRPVAIALETSRGPLVHALLEAPFIVLYPVNPRSLRRFREAFSPNGAKDDVPDARLLLDLLVKHREQLHAWRPSDAATRALEILVEQRRTAIQLQVQLTQQLGAVLKEYFPQALEWAGEDLASAMACAFLTQWPSLAAVQRARPSTLRRFYTQHGCRRSTRIAARLSAMRDAEPLTTDPAVITPRELYVQLLVHQLQALAPSLARLDAAIAEQFATHPDAAIFDSFPGAGAVMAPRLAAAFGTDRTRFPLAVAMQTHAGIAPVTIRSGRQSQVHWRWATSTFVRQTFHEFAQHSVRSCAWARVFYRTQREHGKSRHAAIRALAFKWIRILWKCWYDRVPYDNARYERALALRHSPLNKLLTQATAAA